MRFQITEGDVNLLVRSPSASNGSVPIRMWPLELLHLKPHQVNELLWWLASFCAEGCHDRDREVPPLVQAVLDAAKVVRS